MRIENRVALRLPAKLHAQLQLIAARDANGLSATIRRLLARALAADLDGARHDG